jgi:hypothetical protein
MSVLFCKTYALITIIAPVGSAAYFATHAIPRSDFSKKAQNDSGQQSLILEVTSCENASSRTCMATERSWSFYSAISLVRQAQCGTQQFMGSRFRLRISPANESTAQQQFTITLTRWVVRPKTGTES